MPKLSVWALRASLLYLGVGISIGALLLWNKGLPIDPRLWVLLPAHIEFLLLGWIAQAAIGVGYWILPRHSSSPRRGNRAIAWSSIALLNVGILLVAFSPAFQWTGHVVLFGRVLELSAAVAFVMNSWPRLRNIVDL